MTLLSGPILLSPTTTSYHQLLQTIKEDCMARYFRMLGKQVSYCPRFAYQTGSTQGEEKKITTNQRGKQIDKQREKQIKHMIQLGIGFDETQCTSIISPLTTRKLRNTIDHYMQK